MPRKHEAAGQRRLELSNRAKQLRDLRELRIGDTAAKLLLYVLDNRAGEASVWEMPTADLQAEAELKRTKFYDALRHLQDAGIVIVEDVRDRRHRKRFRIVRSEIADRVRHQGRTAGTKARPASSSAIRMADDSVRIPADSVRIPDGTVRIPDDTTERPIAPHQRPQAQPGWSEAAAAEIVSEMIQLGVEHPVPALDAAAARGASAGHVLALIAHFAEQAGANGWQPGALQRRISQADPQVPVAMGWPPADPRARRQQARQAEQQGQVEADGLEARGGELLDRLDPDERVALAARVFDASSTELRLVQLCGRARITDRRLRLPLIRALLEAEQKEATT